MVYDRMRVHASAHAPLAPLTYADRTRDRPVRVFHAPGGSHLHRYGARRPFARVTDHSHLLLLIRAAATAASSSSPASPRNGACQSPYQRLNHHDQEPVNLSIASATLVASEIRDAVLIVDAERFLFVTIDVNA